MSAQRIIENMIYNPQANYFHCLWIFYANGDIVRDGEEICDKSGNM